MLKILICEDLVGESTRLEKFVDNYFNFKKISHTITVYDNAEDGIFDYENDKTYDIALLDIILPHKTGIDLAKVIRKYDQFCNIIFITSSREFAIESYQVKAFNYLLKPFDEKSLSVLLEDLMVSIKNHDDKFVTLTSRYGCYKIKLRDVIYVESFKRQITFHIDKQDDIIVNDKLDNIEGILNDSRFLRCHKSYLINMDQVSMLESRSFKFSNGMVAPIPKENLNTVKQKYFDYLYNKVEE
ncbi:MAG: LytTR family DNA-binding domain-containing protein [Erysipelotrichaceae bacterium]